MNSRDNGYVKIGEYENCMFNQMAYICDFCFPPTCFSLLCCSFLPWFEVFYNFLNILAEIMNRSEDNDVTVMLRAAYVQEVPSPGLPVTIVAGQEVRHILL